MEAEAILIQNFPATLLTINEDDNVSDLEASSAERGGSLKDGGATSNEVFNNEAVLTRAEGAFYGFGSTVVFDFFAAHEHRDVGGEGDRRGNGEGGVGDAAEKVVGGEGEGGKGEEEGRYLAEERWVGDDESEVDVDWRIDTRFELEVAELDGINLVQLEN